MRLSDFDFDLPEALIAQEPRPRGGARLLVVRRDSQSWEERRIADCQHSAISLAETEEPLFAVITVFLIYCDDALRIGKCELSFFE